MEKRGKKAITNIEMIIATTIFIFSIIVIVYYINFIGIQREPSEALLDIIEKNLREETEVSYNLTYLVISSSAPCFNITKHSSIIEENKTFIKETTTVYFNATTDRLLIEGEGQQNHIFAIYTFPFNIVNLYQFIPSNCPELDEKDYNYSITYEDKIFVYENLIQLLTIPYNDLKQQWNFKEDFSINLSVTGQNWSVSGTKPLQASVKARQFSIKIINRTGNIFEGIVNIQVW
ncbi:MAG: hypothetical protein N3G19_02145 [Candidatus Pacearchaeota archaeon]|nr:hypothetical protein [Candidatus Pacearchaeota archaeon]